MGYFSWLTSDTKQSIPVVASGREMKPVSIGTSFITARR